MKKISMDMSAIKEKLGLNVEGGIVGYIQARSKREKFLLYALVVIIVITVGFGLMIKPASEKHDEVNDLLIQKQQEQQEIVLAISILEATKDQIKDTKGNIDDIRPKFNAIMMNEDIDTLITQMILGCGLKPNSLSIEAASQSDDGSVGNAGDSGDGSQAQTESDSSSDQTTDSSGDGTLGSGSSSEATGDSASPAENADLEGTPVGYGTVKTELVTVSVSGKLSQIVALIGTANASKGVAILSFNISKNESTATANDGLLSSVATRSKQKVFPYTAEIVFKVYQSTESK